MLRGVQRVVEAVQVAAADSTEVEAVALAAAALFGTLRIRHLAVEAEVGVEGAVGNRE